MRRRLALGGRGRRAGVGVPGPRLLLRQVALFEQHVLPGRRDPRVLVLVEDDLRLRRRAGRLVLVPRRATGVRAAIATSGPTRLVPAALPVPVKAVRARVILLALHEPVSQSFFFVLFAGWSCKRN